MLPSVCLLPVILSPLFLAGCRPQGVSEVLGGNRDASRVPGRRFVEACWQASGCNPSLGGSDSEATPLVVAARSCGALPGRGDARAAIQKAIDIAACESIQRSPRVPVSVTLEAGSYDIGWNEQTPEDLHSLIIKDSEGLIFDGRGATLVFTNPSVGAMNVRHNKNITIKRLTYDYATTPFTQGTIRSVHDTYFVITIDAGFPAPDDASLFRNARVSQDPDKFITDSAFAFAAENPQGVRQGMGAIWLPQRRSCSEMAESVAGTPSTYRIYPRGKTGQNCDAPGVVPQTGDLAQHFLNNRFVPGARVVMLARSSQFSTVDFKENDNVTLTDLTTYASAGGTHFAWEHNEGRIVARGAKFLIKPGSNRLVSANGDGFNANRSNRAVFDIQESVFHKLADDVINLNTFAIELVPGVTVEALPGQVLRFPRKFPWYRKHFAAGDVLVFANIHTAKRVMTEKPVVVDRVEDDCGGGGWNDTDNFCMWVKADAAYSLMPTSPDNDLVLLNESVASRGSIFANNEIVLPRGAVTVSSPETKIHGNKARVCAWFLQIPMDMNWKQGPFPHDLEVTGNTVTVDDPASFVTPALVYAFQHGAKGDSNAATVFDLYGLKAAGNRFHTGNDPQHPVAAIKLRNSLAAPGTLFWVLENGRRKLYKALQGSDICEPRSPNDDLNIPQLEHMPPLYRNVGACP